MRQFLVITFMAGALTAAGQTSETSQNSVPNQTNKTSEPGYFKHLDLSVNLGTSGIGFDLATPIGNYVQLRAGYEFMPHFRYGVDFPVEVGGEPAVKYDENGNRVESRFDVLAKNLKQITGLEVDDHVEMIGKMTMNNFKLLVDVFPFQNNKHWHFTAGFYLGASEFASGNNSMDAMVSLLAVDMYNNMYERVENFWETGEPIMSITIDGTPYVVPELQPHQVKAILNAGRMGFQLGKYKEDMYSESGLLIHQKGEAYVMEPGEDHQVHVYAKSSAFKPYLGFGYGGRLVKGCDDWKVSFDAGLMFWGSIDLFTHDGTNLTKDVEGITGKVGDYVDFAKKLTVYPSVSVRFTKTLF